jgi:hypothetical protein
MHNSNDKKVPLSISDRKLEILFHPLYSPDVSPCDFLPFGIVNSKMKDRTFQTIESDDNDLRRSNIARHLFRLPQL